MYDYDRTKFYHALLDALDAPKNEKNLAALEAWGECEGSAARYNPLDTTQEEAGATPFNTFESNGVTLHVWNYPDEETGVRATVQTLENGHYPHILAALRKGNGRGIVLGNARREMGVWGTNADCIAEKLGPPPKNDKKDDDEPAHPGTPLTQTQRDDVTRVTRTLMNHHDPLTEHDHHAIKALIKAANSAVKR